VKKLESSRGILTKRSIKRKITESEPSTLSTSRLGSLKSRKRAFYLCDLDYSSRVVVSVMSDVMISLSRQEIVQTTKYVVVKVGTNVLTTRDGLLNSERIRQLVKEICAIRQRGIDVVLVSSGAVGAGMGRLGLSKRPKWSPELQAVAATGQSALIQCYEQELDAYGVLAAQILLTAGDLSNRSRYLNACNTFYSLFRLKKKPLPIVNENDVVSSSELSLTFGDNDRLASLVANLFPESLLILLTDVDGLYDGDPALPGSKLVPVVDVWTPKLMEMVAEKRSSRSKGGMSSKLRAAQTVTSVGGALIIANGDDPNVLTKIFSGEECGTVFFPTKSLPAKEHWKEHEFRYFESQSRKERCSRLLESKPKGTLVVDDGAVKALTEQRDRSLLPVGVQNVFGSFKKGDVVAIVDQNEREIARGLVNYSSKEASVVVSIINKIKSENARESDARRTSSKIREALGKKALPYAELVHRNNIRLSQTPTL